MYRYLLITSILFLLLFAPSQTTAATRTLPQPPKYQGLWQKITLRDLLRTKIEALENKDTKTPTVTTTQKKNLQPQPVAPQTTSVTDYIMKEINEYRSSQGLSTVQTSKETCDFAKLRAQEIATNFNHDGFSQRRDNKTIPYTSWTAITENIAMTSNYKDVVTMWKNSTGHAANMRANTPFVCVMENGNYYAYEGMKP